MAATASQIAQIRRMVNEPTEATYTDAMITAAIEARPKRDPRGVEWFVWDFSTTPPTQDENDNWIPSYDLNAAAADIWDEKAAAVAACTAFSADGGNYSLNQKFEQYRRMATVYRSRASVRSMRLRATQRELTPEGVLVETTPIIDQYDRSEVFNS